MIYAGRSRTFRMDPFIGLTSQRIKDSFEIFARPAFAIDLVHCCFRFRRHPID